MWVNIFELINASRSQQKPAWLSVWIPLQIQAGACGHANGVILDGFVFGLPNQAVSNRALAEYEEIIEPYAGPQRSSGKDVADYLSMNIRQPEVAPRIAVGELLMLDAE